MTDQKLTALTAFTPALSDIVYGVDDPGGTPVSGKMTLQAILDLFEANASFTADVDFAADLQLAVASNILTNGVTSTTGIGQGTAATDAINISTTIIQIQSGAKDCMQLSKPSGYTDNDFMTFWVNNSAVGSVDTDGSSTNYNTTSDERAKEGVRPAALEANAMKGVGLHEFSFKSDPAKRRQRGLLAQEVETVVPEAVSETEGVKMVDHGRFAAIALVSALRRIEALEARVDALEAV